MMTLGLVSWLFLAVAALMIGVGTFTISGALVRKMNIESCPYTCESMAAASRWAGLSITAFGLGLASFVLMNKVLFTIGSFGCTVGLVTFLVMIAMSRIVGAKSAAELIRKEEAAEEKDNVVGILQKEDDEDHHDDKDDHHDCNPGDWFDDQNMAA